MDSTETAADPALRENDPLGSFPAEERTDDVVSVASIGGIRPAVAEVPVIHAIAAQRVRTNRRRFRRRPLTRFKRLRALVHWRPTQSQNWNSLRRLKTVRVRPEVSRWTMPFSIFAAGVVVGALTASYGGGSNTSSQTTPSVAPEPAAVRPGASGLEDRGADRVGGGLENRGGLEDRGAEPAGSARAVGTALVAPPQANVSRPSRHRGTLIVTSQPVGASVFVNNRLAGRTPLVMNSVPAGSRALRLSLDGYAAWSRGVSVVANQSTRIAATLEAAR